MKLILKKHFVLLLILLFASFLRLYDLGNIPSGFQGDEASFFLNAQALMLSGRDEDNNLFPLFLRSFIDPKPALYSYLQIPFIYLLGETYFSARLPAVILGIVSIVLAFLIISHFVERKYSYLSAFLLAISPWHIVVSRGTQEVIMSFTFGLGAWYILIKFIKNKKSSFLLLFTFTILLFLSMYSYHSAKIFLLLTLMLYLLFNFFKKSIRTGSAFILILIVISVFLITSVVAGFERYNAVSIFNNPEIQLVLDDKIRSVTGSSPEFIIRVFNNKIIDFIFGLFKNYTDYFSATFLFISGGMPERYKVPFHGLLYVFEGLFLIAGVYYSLLNYKLKKLSMLFLFWLIIAPIPAAITSQEIPSMIRSFFMILPLYFFISVGMIKIFSKLNKPFFKKSYSIQVIFLYIGGLAYFLFQYFILAPNYRPWHRNYGNSILPILVNKYQDDYEKIYISTNQYAYFAIDGFISIEDLQKSYPKRLQMNSEYGKITFINSDCNIFKTNKKVLFVIKYTCADYTKDGEFKLVDTVDFRDGNPEYLFYEPLKVK